MIHRKMKVVNDDWNYFSKIYYLKKNNQMKQILLIQKYISKFLWKISFIKKENEKPENKIKSFYNLIKKCIIKHARNYIFQIFFNRKKKKKRMSLNFFKKIFEDGIKDLKKEKLRIETIPILEQRIKNHEKDIPIINKKEKKPEKVIVKPNVRLLEDMLNEKNKMEIKVKENLEEKEKKEKNMERRENKSKIKVIKIVGKKENVKEKEKKEKNRKKKKKRKRKRI